MISVSAAPAGSSPARRPSRITRMRSLMPISSGSSDEIIRIADALAREPAHEIVDAGLGADVDAAGRLVEDQDARLDREPLGQHDLLLVAAGQEAGLLLEQRARSSTERASSWTLTVPGSRRRCLPPSDRSASRVLSRIGWASARPSSLRSSVMKPMPALIPARGPRPTGLPSTSTVPRSNGVGAEQRAGELGPPGALEPGEADDLARADLDRDVVRGPVWSPPRGPEPDVAELLRRAARREVAVELAPDHHARSAWRCRPRRSPGWRRAAPSLSTVIRSQIAKISRRRWEM